MFNPESTGELETPDFVSKFDTLTHDERHLLAAIFDVQTARLKEDGTDTAHISSLWNKVFASGPITSDEAILLSAILDYQIAGMKKNGTDTDRVTALSNKIIAGNAANLPPVGPSRFLKEII